MKKIVIAEDEAFMREELFLILEKQGYEAYALRSFEHPVDEIIRQKPDLVLLDVNLPGMNGFDICRELKKRGIGPVLILTSRDSMKDEIRGLELGADDYLAKPCRSERLAARIENLLRRYEVNRNILDGGDFRYDRNTHTLFHNGASFLLPDNPGIILGELMAASGETVTKEHLSSTLWGTMEYIDENALQVNMTRLKKTLSGLGLAYHIVTVRGKGYRFIRNIGEEQV